MSKKSFEKELQRYLPFIEAIVELFHPYVEAAVHDLRSGKVAAIYHNISRRKVGDATPIRELNVDAGKFPIISSHIINAIGMGASSNAPPSPFAAKQARPSDWYASISTLPCSSPSVLNWANFWR